MSKLDAELEEATDAIAELQQVLKEARSHLDMVEECLSTIEDITSIDISWEHDTPNIEHLKDALTISNAIFIVEKYLT